MNRTLPAVAASCLLALAAAAPARADVLLIERVAASPDHAMPRRGLSMSQVQAQFGAPSHKVAPVGGDRPQHPPITRWVYPSFSVYFEHDTVIDAVVNDLGAMEDGPRPVPTR